MGIVPPVMLTLELPTAALSVPPLQVVLPLLETVRPVGKLSANDVMVAAVAFGLINVMSRLELPPTEMLAGVKDLVRVGGRTAATTVKVATAGPAFVPLLVVNAPAGSVL
jgi:hypothetical protein